MGLNPVGNGCQLVRKEDVEGCQILRWWVGGTWEDNWGWGESCVGGLGLWSSKEETVSVSTGVPSWQSTGGG